MAAFSCPSFRKLALAGMDCLFYVAERRSITFLHGWLVFHIILQIAKDGKVFIQLNAIAWSFF